MGGSSNHWENNTSQFQPIDFKYREWVPHSGWPISFEDVEPYYEKAQEYCGVDADSYDVQHWSDKLNKNDILQKSEILETQMAKGAAIPTRFFHIHGKNLQKQSNLTIFTNTSALDISYNKTTEDVNKILCKTFTNKEITINARYFVLALGGIENARFLLFANEKYNNNIGNQGDAVGRYFMEHPTVRGAQFFVDEKTKMDLYQPNLDGNKYVTGFQSLTENALVSHQTTNLRIPFIKASEFEMSNGISSSHILGEYISNFEIPDQFGQHLFNVISDSGMVAEGIARKKFDTKLFDYASEFSGYNTVMMIEQTPNPLNRITLGKSKDKFGQRRVKIDYQIFEEDKQFLWKSLEAVAQEYGAESIGRVKILKERESRLWTSQLGFCQHHMGTTRMAKTSENGVVDENQRVFGTNNFFVSGSSVFTTGSHVPPTLTICALSIRLADHIRKEYQNA
jgi:choline dehydrogenase-like flavoprotein